MSAGPEAEHWFTTFFDAVANDFWAAAVAPTRTAAEADFLLAALDVAEGAALVDIAAGRGRLAAAIGSLGMRVTAVDRSADGVQHMADQRWPAVDVVRADMRALPLRQAFDGGFCMGNSFGYFDLDGVRRFLGEVHRVLRPGARFVLETATVAESFARDAAEHTVHRFGGITVSGRHRLEPDRDRLVSELVYDDGRTQTTRTMTQLVLPQARIRSLLEAHGLMVERMLGGIDGQPWSPEADALLVVLRRTGGHRA